MGVKETTSNCSMNIRLLYTGKNCVSSQTTVLIKRIRNTHLLPREKTVVRAIDGREESDVGDIANPLRSERIVSK